MSIIKLITEGDCEGRTTQTVGYFVGTLEQVMTYCVRNNIRPYYHFKKVLVDVVDCSAVVPKLKVQEDSYGRITHSTDEDLEKQAAINSALSKLTVKEKKLLGINS